MIVRIGVAAAIAACAAGALGISAFSPVLTDRQAFAGTPVMIQP